jgi:hypothetical protein
LFSYFINQIMKTMGDGNSLIGNSLFSNMRPQRQPAGGPGVYLHGDQHRQRGHKLGLVVALIYIGMRAADSVGVMGAQAAQKFTNWVSRAGTGAVFSPAGWALRNTVARGAYYASQSAALKNLGASGGIGRVTANLLRGGLDATGRRSFDARGSKLVRSGLGLAGIATNEPRGTGGFAKTYQESVKKKVDEAKYYIPSAEDIDREYQNIISGLPEDEQKHIAQLAKRVEDAQADVDKYGAGDGRGQVLKDATKDQEEVTKKYKKQAEENVGKKFGDVYAKSLVTPNLQNAWGMGLGLFGKGHYSRAAYEAFSKLQGGKKDGAKLAAFLKVKAEDTPEGKVYNKEERAFVDKVQKVGDYEFEIGGKAWMIDNGKEKEITITNFSKDGTKAYFKGKGGKDTLVNIKELHEEKEHTQHERDHLRTYNPTEVGVLAAALLARTPPTPPAPAPAGPRATPEQVITVGNSGQASTFQQQASSYAGNRMSDLVGKTLVRNDGVEFKVEGVDRNKPGGGRITMRQQDGSIVVRSVNNLFRPEVIRNYSVKPTPPPPPPPPPPAPPAPPGPNTNPIVPFTPPQSGGSGATPQTPPRGPGGPVPGARPNNRPGIGPMIPPKPTVSAPNSPQSSNQQNPKPAPIQPINPKDVTETHQWSDGSYHVEPEPLGITHQPTAAPLPAPNTASIQPGLTRDAELRRREAMQNVEPRATNTGFVPPPVKGVGPVTKKEVNDLMVRKFREQENKLNKTLKKAISHATEQLGKYVAGNTDYKQRSEAANKGAITRRQNAAEAQQQGLQAAIRQGQQELRGIAKDIAQNTQHDRVGIPPALNKEGYDIRQAAMDNVEPREVPEAHKEEEGDEKKQ